jgi:general secretion pathway protein A
MLDRPDLRQLKQRIAMRHHLRPFDAIELDAYIDERLRLAGYTGKGIFNRSARKRILAHSGGVPRLVNVICDSALLSGYSKGRHTLGGDVIGEVAQELHLVEIAPESSRALVRAPGPRSTRRRWLDFLRQGG